MYVYFLMHYYRAHDQPNPLHTFQNNVLTIQLFFVYYPSSEENRGKFIQSLDKYPTEKVIKICE